MSPRNASGTILIRENTVLPASLALESEAFLPNWRIVREIDVYGLGREIEDHIGTSSIWPEQSRQSSSAMENPDPCAQQSGQILAKRAGQKWKALEITGVFARRFLGIPFLSVAANCRHIQESLCLNPGREAAARIPAAATPGIEPESKERQYHAKVHIREYPAQV